MGRVCIGLEAVRIVYRSFGRNPEGNKALGRPRRR
jgi:hypothetical protein